MKKKATVSNMKGPKNHKGGLSPQAHPTLGGCKRKAGPKKLNGK